MTLEEALKEIERLNGELTTERKKVTDQNSYITKLEAQVKAKGDANPGSTDPTIQEYIKKKMREDVLAQSLVLIKADVSDEEYKAIEPDFLAFLDKNMKDQNVKVDYILDAFALVLGRAMRKKDHPIHSVKAATPPASTTPPGKGNPAVPPVNQPPGITGADGGSTPPPSTEKKIGNTKDAFASLREKMGNIGGNRFS